MGKTAVLLALLMTLVQPAAMALADDATPPVTRFSACAEVRVAEIEVFVTDRQGRPVHGLTAADFRLYQDGERVEISNFYAVREEGGPEAGLLA